MALSPKVITEKIGSVSNIKKITKAMEMVAASKMKKAVDRALGVRTYGEAALNLLLTLSQERDIDHPLLRPGDGDQTLIVMVAADKGLCGSYNTSIYKRVDKYLRENDIQSEKAAIMALGKYAERFALRRGIRLVGSWHDILDAKSVDDIRSISQIAIEEFSSGKYKNVVFFYTRFISALSQKPVLRTVLPVKAATAEKIIEEVADDSEETFKKVSMPLYIFEPSEEQVLGEVIPRLVDIMFYEGILEAVASEHSSRMMAMKNATDNAKSLVEDLTLSFNRARQAAVTREIAEISAGAEALTS